MATLDIGGAFLNADIKLSGVIVHMRLDKTMSGILVEIDPTYAAFVNPETGVLTVELDKALYGCVEAAKLWYDNPFLMHLHSLGIVVGVPVADSSGRLWSVVDAPEGPREFVVFERLCLAARYGTEAARTRAYIAEHHEGRRPP